MERNVGEIFEYNGDWYQCVIGGRCNDCAFNGEVKCYNFTNDNDPVGTCSSLTRTDKHTVIFKKLEKLGDPFERNGYMYQEYKANTFPVLMNGDAKIPTPNGFAVIIKQNQENMEENYKAEDTLLTRLVGRYVNNLIDYETFEKAVKELYSDKRDSKPTLKEFDLKAAKSGKPVCTRDGRKARIICFDAKNIGNDRPIIGLVSLQEGQEQEFMVRYDSNGKYYSDKSLNLMMLPEKHEGWVNIYKSDNETYYTGAIFYQKNDALVNTAEIEITTGIPRDCIDTVKIEWEE